MITDECDEGFQVAVEGYKFKSGAQSVGDFENNPVNIAIFNGPKRSSYIAEIVSDRRYADAPILHTLGYRDLKDGSVVGLALSIGIINGETGYRSFEVVAHRHPQARSHARGVLLNQERTLH